MNIQERINNKYKFDNAYNKLIELFFLIKRTENYDELIKYFYEIGKNYSQPEYNSDLFNLSNEQKISVLKQLIKEIINLDFCYYVSTGINPELGLKFKNKILELT